MSAVPAADPNACAGCAARRSTELLRDECVLALVMVLKAGRQRLDEIIHDLCPYHAHFFEHAVTSWVRTLPPIPAKQYAWKHWK